MQVFAAAGAPVVGDAFPRDWARLSVANPRGFFESSLREGINFTTNPDPETGAVLVPAETRGWVVKIFHQGMPRTEGVWLDRVLVTVRDWRAYCASVLRLEDLERLTIGVADRDPLRVDPAVEWLRENLLTLRDLDARGYPCRYVTTEAAVADPAALVGDVLAWVGGALDVGAAIASVEPGLASRASLSPPWVRPEHAAVYDAFYAAVARGRPLDALARMEALEAELVGELAADPARHRARTSVYRAALGAT